MTLMISGSTKPESHATVNTSSLHRESFEAIGEVKVYQFNLGDAENKHLITKNNLIVSLGRKTLMDMLLGQKVAKLTYIRFGNGGALKFPDGDPLTPLPVQDEDLDVARFVLQKTLSKPIRLNDNEVQYHETLICDEIDGDVNEAALFLKDSNTGTDSIFARITFPTVRLTIDKGTGIEIVWKISFVRVIRN